MAHQPIQFGPDKSGGEGQAAAGQLGGVPGENPGAAPDPADLRARPVELDLKKDVALTVRWDDGRVSVYPVKYLRRYSPSAESKALREEIARNPLTVLPASAGGAAGEKVPLTATGADLIGNYALRVEFSDGHRTGLYTWPYLRQIDPQRTPPGQPPADPDASVRP